MKADFFRILFHKTERGIYYTSAMKDEHKEESLHVAYINEEAKILEEESYPLDILAVGDWRPGTILQAKEILSRRFVDMVIVPAHEEDQGEFEEFCKANNVREFRTANELIVVLKSRWELFFGTFQGKEGNTLGMYQGFTGDDLEKEDCAFSVKPVCRESCVSCLYGEDDYCGFGCFGKTDIDVLKGHKRKGSTCYKMGTLILGSMDLQEQSQELAEFVKPIADKLRCICLPYGAEDETQAGILTGYGKQDYLYAVGHENGVGSAFAGKMVLGNPYIRYQTINESYGFCMSGYRIPYMNRRQGQ